ncbi:MAG: group II intron reverse transcriptase/maturase, partial [Synergistaceae bacterium]|nr:group II intron reverse transcriptase/maturase [Synergistaceae bacterium]
EHAIAETYRRLQRSNLHFVVEFDIKGFFDNVNHQKLLHQMYALGIQDEVSKSKVKRILKAPIKMPDGKLMYPRKGTPQGGIISPLLANIVLNELDYWVESDWEKNHVTHKYSLVKISKGSINKGHGYRAMRGTKLKEMYIVRYADDFRIFCRTKTAVAQLEYRYYS